jgi:hypothetical protein
MLPEVALMELRPTRTFSSPGDERGHKKRLNTASPQTLVKVWRRIFGLLKWSMRTSPKLCESAFRRQGNRGRKKPLLDCLGMSKQRFSSQSKKSAGAGDVLLLWQTASNMDRLRNDELMREDAVHA